jgi:hypothetical protein
MPSESSRPQAGLADLPDVVDLRQLSDEALEMRGMELRQRIANLRAHIRRALEERTFRRQPGSVSEIRNRRIEGHVEELQLVLEGLRSGLIDVDREQERRVENTFREREASILDSTRWATWAAFAAAAAAAVASAAALMVK